MVNFESCDVISWPQVIVLQSYFRRWQAKRQVQKLRVDLSQRLEWERKEAVRKVKEKEDRIRREFEKRMNPRTKEDFDLLYHALESKCSHASMGTDMPLWVPD